MEGTICCAAAPETGPKTTPPPPPETPIAPTRIENLNRIMLPLQQMTSGMPWRRVCDPVTLEQAGVDRDAFIEQGVIQDATSLHSFRRFILPGLRGADEAVMERIANDYALDDLPERTHPEPFTAPALDLFERQDDVVGYEDGLALRAHYPRGSFVVVDGAGHDVHLERPELTRAAVRDWPDRIDRGDAAP